MNCRQTACSLVPYLDEELDPITKADLWTHLDACEDCRILFEAEEALEGEIARVLHVHPVSRIWDTLPARLPPTVSRGVILWALFSALLLAVGAAFVLLAAILGRFRPEGGGAP